MSSVLKAGGGCGSKKTGQQVLRIGIGGRLKWVGEAGLDRDVVPSAVVVVMSSESGLLEILRGWDWTTFGRILKPGCQIV